MLLLFLFLFLKKSTCEELMNQHFGYDLVCPYCHITASPQILKSHAHVFPEWAQSPILRNGFAEHLQAMVQPCKSVCHEWFP